MSTTFFHTSRSEYQYLNSNQEWKMYCLSWSKPEGPSHEHHMKEALKLSEMGKARCVDNTASQQMGGICILDEISVA